MESFIYITKSIAILSIFYGIYHIVLQKDTFFSANRHYLLSGIVAALVFPFVEYTETIYKDIPVMDSFIVEDIAFVNEMTTVTEAQQEAVLINWWQIALIIYAIGFTIMIIRLLLQLFSLYKLISAYPKTHKDGYTYVAITDKVITPFSFFTTICYNPTLHTPKELEMILAHEKIHVRQRHTIDILLTQCMLAIQWLNPLAWLYKKSLEQNLEYIADNGAIQEVSSSKEYQHTLVKVSSTLIQPALTNNFYHSLIKKRIVMLNKQTSRKHNLWKLGLVLPALALFMYSFNVKEVVEYREISVNTETTLDAGEVNTELDRNTKTETSESILISENTIAFNIDAQTTDNQLATIENDLANQGIFIVFSNTQKNKDNKIAAITIETRFQDVKRLSSWTVTEKNKGDGIHKTTLSYSIPSKDVQITLGAFTIGKYIADPSDIVIKPLAEATNGYTQFLITKESTDEQLKQIEAYFKETFESTQVRFTKVNHRDQKLVGFDFQTKMADDARFFTRFSVESAEHLSPFSLLPISEHEILKADQDGSKIKFTPEQSFTTFKIRQESMGEHPILVVNGTVIDTKNQDIVYETDEGVNLVMPSKAMALYGGKAKDGAIVIEDPNYTTKINGKYIKTPKHITTNPNRGIAKEISPTQFRIQITKNTTDQELEKIKKELEEQHGFDFNYSVERNNQNEIIALKIKYKTAKNNSGNYSVSSDSPIADVYIFEDEDGKTGVGTSRSVEEMKAKMQERQALMQERMTEMKEVQKERQEKLESMRQSEIERREEFKKRMKERQEELEERKEIQEEKLQERREELEKKRALIEEKKAEMRQDQKTGYATINGEKVYFSVRDGEKQYYDRFGNQINEEGDPIDASKKKLFITSSPKGVMTNANQGGVVTNFITKTTTDLELKNIQSSYENDGIKFSYKSLRRNDQGEITGVTLKLSNKDGTKTAATFKSTTEAIPTIYIGYTKNQ